MQTFLPYPSFIKSAQCLDNKRLGKQRVEAYQILQILTKQADFNTHKKIQLTDGSYTLVSQQDYERYKDMVWYWGGSNTPSVCSKIHSKTVFLHRLIMNAKEGEIIDHIDHNTLNNCRSNLRKCTHADNMHNSTSRKGTSKFKGVSKCTDRDKWITCIRFEGKTYNLGRYDNEIDAAHAYDIKAAELFGEFANPNFKIAFENHPAVKMWVGYEKCLVKYLQIICLEWKHRGYKDSILEKTLQLVGFIEELELNDYPPFIGYKDFHLSHQSNLIRKYPEHYRPIFGDNIPDNLPYIWR